MMSEQKCIPVRHAILASLLAALISLLLAACGVPPACCGPARPMIPQTERTLTYPGVGGVTLAGTLEIPVHRSDQQVPGVIIVAGSGPVDRDGNEPAAGFMTDLYQQIADQLAQQGIASLRYDKRGVGASTPPVLTHFLRSAKQSTRWCPADETVST